MTPEQAEARVEEVRRATDEQYDNEEAHGLEDDLYVDALKAIASGDVDDPAELARIVLKASALGYERWYA